MSAPNELDIDSDDFCQDAEVAVACARDKGSITWLTEEGKRVAAVVPVDVAARYEEAMTVMVSGRHHGG
jgi:hypothetical protein